MKFKLKLLAVAAPLAFSLSSGTANATVTNLTPDPFTGFYADAFTVGNGFFWDTINFSIDTPSLLDVSANTMDLHVAGMDIFKIDGLLGGLKYSINGPGGFFSGVLNGNDTDYNFNLTSIGDYHINLIGFGTGTQGGLYGVGLSVTPVPEPENYAMLLAGLGMIGFVARRRTNKP